MDKQSTDDREYSRLKNEVLMELHEMEKDGGTCGFYYRNLVTGQEFGYNSDFKFLAASIVKLPLLAAMFLMREKGETDFSEKITIREDQKLPGCGAVQHMTGDVTLDIETLYKLMIVISDTTATNALFRHYGAEKIGRCFRELGLSGTQFNRAYYDYEKENRGINNYFTTREMADLLERIFRHELVSEKASEEMEEILSTRTYCIAQGTIFHIL